MSLTINEVSAALGEEAQVCGGSVVIYRNGKHVLVAHTVGETFLVTLEGEEVLNGTTITADGVTVLAPDVEEDTLQVVEAVVEDLDAALNAALAG